MKSEGKWGLFSTEDKPVINKVILLLAIGVILAMKMLLSTATVALSSRPEWICTEFLRPDLGVLNTCTYVSMIKIADWWLQSWGSHLIGGPLAV